jgi:hypothetical protein
MAEMIFDCPACKQPVQADEAWAGQEIQCPLCHAPMIVPPAPAPVPHGIGQQLVSVPKETKLSAGGTQKPRSTGTGAVVRNFHKPVKKQNPIMKYAVPALVIIAVAAGGWFGWPYLKPHLPFLNKDDAAASASTATDPAAAAAEVTPPPPKEVPMTPPIYTLDVAQAKISEGKVNGSIAGTNFAPDLVRLDKLAGLYVLELRQGAGATPDRGFKVVLNLGPTGSPTNQTWTVGQDMKGTPVSRVVKVWKTNPKFAAQEKAFTTGFALKLEFGQMTETNTIPGKIYAAVPDKEQTVIGGTFLATMGGVPGAPQPVAAPVPSPETMSPEFQRRYGAPARP